MKKILTAFLAIAIVLLATGCAQRTRDRASARSSTAVQQRAGRTRSAAFSSARSGVGV